MSDLLVAEVFGPTIQGEGPSTGQRATFVRLGGCNLSCSWCDTPYTWDWTGKNGKAYSPKDELRQVAYDELTRDVLRRFGNDLWTERLLVITGGEPMLQRDRLWDWLNNEWPHHVLAFAPPKFRVEIETNGTVEPGPFLSGYARAAFVRFNVSPKLAHSGDDVSRRINPDALRALAGTPHVAFKFVVREPSDLIDIEREFVVPYLIDPSSVWVMPEGKTREDISARLPLLADHAIRYRFNVSTRLHVLMWGNERGR